MVNRKRVNLNEKSRFSYMDTLLIRNANQKSNKYFENKQKILLKVEEI